MDPIFSNVFTSLVLRCVAHTMSALFQILVMNNLELITPNPCERLLNYYRLLLFLGVLNVQILNFSI